MRLSFRFVFSVLAMVACITGLAGTSQVSAHQDPSGCTASGFGLSLSVYETDGVTPALNAQPGEIIKYQATLSHLGLPSCSFDNGTLTITLPNGSVVDVTPGGPGIPLVQIGTPFQSALVNYTVSSADVDVDDLLNASAAYVDGRSHVGGRHQTVGGVVTISTNFTKLDPSVTTQVHNPGHGDVTNTAIAAGTDVHDQATVVVQNAVSPTGNARFTLFDTDACQGNVLSSQIVAMDPSGVVESNTITPVAGAYSYLMDYTGDDNYNAGQAACEPFRVVESRIIVEKQTDPDQSPVSFDFSASYDQDGFSLTDGGQNNSGTLLPGTYTVSEVLPAGWANTSATCSDQSDPSNIQLDLGETVTCTFVNTQLSTIIVEKQTNPDGGSGNFTFTGDVAGQISDDGQITVTDLLPGTYTATENDPLPSYALESISCSDLNSSGDLDSRTATFQVEAGETITCVFTNLRLLQESSVTTQVHTPSHTDITFGSAVYGTPVHDQATVAGDGIVVPTGTVDFQLFANNSCSGESLLTDTDAAVVSGVAESAAHSDLEPGVYGFLASYNGDGNYLGSQGVCEPFEVTHTTRTQGFWQTHTSFTSSIFGNELGGSLMVGSAPHKGAITNVQAAGASQLFGAYYSSVANKSTGQKRLAIDKARMQLLQQLVSAELNCAAFGCSASATALIAQAHTAYAGTNQGQIISLAGQLDAYNNGGDAGSIPSSLGPIGSATPDTSQAYANKVFWNTP